MQSVEVGTVVSKGEALPVAALMEGKDLKRNISANEDPIRIDTWDATDPGLSFNR